MLQYPSKCQFSLLSIASFFVNTNDKIIMNYSNYSNIVEINKTFSNAYFSFSEDNLNNIEVEIIALNTKSVTNFNGISANVINNIW